MQGTHCFFHKFSDTTSSLQMITYYKKNSISSQYLSLSENTVRHYHTQYLHALYPCNILLHKPTKASGPRTVLPIITPCSIEGKSFSKSMRDQWHIIENDRQLHSIWPNHPIIAYHKTISLKDILIHCHQTKPTYLCHKTTPNQNH